MALESRDDRSSGMFSASVSNAIGSDGSAADQKVPFPLLFARETEQNGRRVTARFLPTAAVTPAQKAFNQRLSAAVQTYLSRCTFECARARNPHLDAVLHLHVSQQFAVDAEETKVPLVIVDDAVSFSGGLNETRTQAAFRGLQGPQQVPVHGVDQTRTLWTNRMVGETKQTR